MKIILQILSVLVQSGSKLCSCVSKTQHFNKCKISLHDYFILHFYSFFKFCLPPRLIHAPRVLDTSEYSDSRYGDDIRCSNFNSQVSHVLFSMFLLIANLTLSYWQWKFKIYLTPQNLIFKAFKWQNGIYSMSVAAGIGEFYDSRLSYFLFHGFFSSDSMSLTH